jgi:hypothetical protein
VSSKSNSCPFKTRSCCCDRCQRRPPPGFRCLFPRAAFHGSRAAVPPDRAPRGLYATEPSVAHPQQPPQVDQQLCGSGFVTAPTLQPMARWHVLDIRLSGTAAMYMALGRVFPLCMSTTRAAILTRSGSKNGRSGRAEDDDRRAA